MTSTIDAVHEMELLQVLVKHPGLLRNLMDKSEIQAANRLIKKDLVYKSTSVERPYTVIYFLTAEGEAAADNLEGIYQ